MVTFNPRARGDGSLRGELAARRKREEQLGRQRVEMPKPTPAPVATGGGVVGMAEVRSTSGSVIFGAGQIEMSYQGVTYSAPSDPNTGGGGAAPSLSWVRVDGYQIFLDPGWYIPVLSLACIWNNGGAPASFGGPYMGGGWDAVHNDRPTCPSATIGSGMTGFMQIANFGPTYMQLGGYLHAELRAIGGPATGGNDPVQSYATWNITKLG